MNLTKVLLLFSFFVITGLTTTSCGDSEPECSEAAFDRDLENETDKIIEALTAFSLDPTNPNLCNDYRDALENFLDELERYRSCAEEIGELAEFNEALADGRESLNDTVCP